MKAKIPFARQEMLKSLPLFRGLSDAQLARVDRLVTDVELATGESLTREGHVGRQAFVIVTGRAAVTIAGRPVAIVGAGEIIGEMSLLDRSARVATVQALTPMHVLVLDPRGFGALLEERPVPTEVLRTLVGRLRMAEAESPSRPVP